MSKNILVLIAAVFVMTIPQLAWSIECVELSSGEVFCSDSTGVIAPAPNAEPTSYELSLLDYFDWFNALCRYSPAYCSVYGDIFYDESPDPIAVPAPPYKAGT